MQYIVMLSGSFAIVCPPGGVNLPAETASGVGNLTVSFRKTWMAQGFGLCRAWIQGFAGWVADNCRFSGSPAGTAGQRYAAGCCVSAILRLTGFLIKVGVQFAGAFGAYAVAEAGIGVFPYVGFYLLPVAFVVPYLLAACANRQKAAQCLDL